MIDTIEARFRALQAKGALVDFHLKLLDGLELSRPLMYLIAGWGSLDS